MLDQIDLHEKRRYRRIDGHFHALIRFVEGHGLEERIATLLNLSAGGCYVALDHPLPEQTKVFILTRVSSERHPHARGPRLALRGVVVRVSCDSERPGVGVRLTSYRFLPPDPQAVP